VVGDWVDQELDRQQLLVGCLITGVPLPITRVPHILCFCVAETP